MNIILSHRSIYLNIFVVLMVLIAIIAASAPDTSITLSPIILDVVKLLLPYTVIWTNKV